MPPREPAKVQTFMGSVTPCHIHGLWGPRPDDSRAVQLLNDGTQVRVGATDLGRVRSLCRLIRRQQEAVAQRELALELVEPVSRCLVRGRIVLAT